MTVTLDVYPSKGTVSGAKGTSEGVAELRYQKMMQKRAVRWGRENDRSHIRAGHGVDIVHKQTPILEDRGLLDIVIPVQRLTPSPLRGIPGRADVVSGTACLRDRHLNVNLIHPVAPSGGTHRRVVAATGRDVERSRAIRCRTTPRGRERKVQACGEALATASATLG